MTCPAGRYARLACAAVLLGCGGRAALAQSAPVPVVAVGEGRGFTAALSSAVRVAVESGAGVTVTSVTASTGEHIVTDSTRAVSRGVVTRYILLDSSSVGGIARVRILAMVSRIAERDAVAAPADRVAVPGALWRANADVDADRRRAEGDLLFGVFGAIDRQPSAYTYAVESGPPIENGAARRLRIRVIRTPSAAYSALRARAQSILSAVAGPAGVAVTHAPSLDHERVIVTACVSHCGPDERRVLNPRAAIEDTDSLGAFDPPVLTGPTAARMQTLFPALPTVGGFAVAFTDSAGKRETLAHVRSTRGYLAAVDYLRSTFDDARFRLEIGDRAIDLLEAFRSPYSGQPVRRFETTAPPGALPIVLVRGFEPRTRGGPGAATSLGSPYVVLTVPAAGDVRADTALVDVWLTAREEAQIAEVGVAPLATTHRLPEIRCAADARSPQRAACARPPAADVLWRALDPAPPATTAALSAGLLPVGSLADGTPTRREPASQRPAAAWTSRAPEPPVPLAVVDAIGRPPLADGDGALAIPAPQPTVVAVGTAVIDAAAPAQACAVARLRAQSELTRFLSGTHIESRTSVTTSETRGAPVDEHFREDITEVAAGRMAGTAIAAQWSVPTPPRCRVALWTSGDSLIRHDPGDPPPR